MSCFYKCNKCSCRIIGTDTELIRQLPIIAQTEFPAFLTKRSGISRDLADLMRPLVQSSTGPLRLSNILQELHLKRYDTLQFQYLANYKYRVDNSSSLISLPVPAPEFSKFNDKDGYNGYYPSANYLSFVYTSLIATLRPHLDNQIMKVDGVILKGDHTFKAASNISPLASGVNVFDALYTVTNEYEEIRLQSFVLTKSLIHLITSFDKLWNAYTMYGYEKPKIFYTDNVRTDSNFLEEHLPSLLENVQPIDGLPVATIPHGLEIIVSNTVEEMNNHCLSILSNYSGLFVLINYKRSSINGRNVVRISIATLDCKVFIFKIINNNFSSALRRIFEDASIGKIGNRLNVLVASLNEQYPALLLQIRNSVGFTSFCNNRSPNGSGSTLTDFCRIFFDLKFPKEPTLVESGRWEAEILDNTQVQRLALESYFMLRVYCKAKSVETLYTSFSDIPPVNTYVALFPRNSLSMTPSAFGYIREKSSQAFGVPMRRNLKSNKTVLVEITEILKPNMRLQEHGPKKTLDNTGCSHSFVVVNKVMLRQCPPNNGNGGNTRNSVVQANNNNQANELRRYSELLNEDGPNAVVGNATTNNDTTSTHTSRVLKDVFHLIDMIKVPIKHTLCSEFKAKFRDILLVPDPADKANVSRVLESMNTTWDYKVVTNSAWVWSRVKRRIPPANQLLPLLKKLFDEYGPIICTDINLPLFDRDAKKTADNVLETVRLGHVSDPEGIPLYTLYGYDSNGLTKYHCCRGTNSLEGNKQ